MQKFKRFLQCSTPQKIKNNISIIKPTIKTSRTRVSNYRKCKNLKKSESFVYNSKISQINKDNSFNNEKNNSPVKDINIFNSVDNIYKCPNQDKNEIDVVSRFSRVSEYPRIFNS